jgi:hypothetical protein
MGGPAEYSKGSQKRNRLDCFISVARLFLLWLKSDTFATLQQLAGNAGNPANSRVPLALQK